jgi:hypothetical protein
LSVGIEIFKSKLQAKRSIPFWHSFRIEALHHVPKKHRGEYHGEAIIVGFEIVVDPIAQVPPLEHALAGWSRCAQAVHEDGCTYAASRHSADHEQMVAEATEDVKQNYENFVSQSM